ncbi:MAG: hypothetical protein JJT94_05795 [Bernardetiaceae bacterium]|nr:hypothetical protein [Bernardetiaceae bacterium]
MENNINIDIPGVELHTEMPHAKLYLMRAKGVAICQATKNFIPREEFKLLFERASELIRLNAIRKFIFDKRALTLFDQAAMEWYHFEWKKDMLALGLNTHRKILPDDTIFRNSVKICREAIFSDPDAAKIAHLSQIEIKYAESMQEAIAE